VISFDHAHTITRIISSVGQHNTELRTDYKVYLKNTTLLIAFNVGDTVELKGKTGRKTNRCTIKLCSDETLPTILHVNTYKN
jgi:hypothetical protein